MSERSIKLRMVGKLDSTPEQAPYYFTHPDLPCLVDLSKCIIFVHPVTNQDGSLAADLVIKNYYPSAEKPSKES